MELEIKAETSISTQVGKEYASFTWAGINQGNLQRDFQRQASSRLNTT